MTENLLIKSIAVATQQVAFVACEGVFKFCTVEIVLTCKMEIFPYFYQSHRACCTILSRYGMAWISRSFGS